MIAWPSLRRCVRFNILVWAALLSFLPVRAFSQEIIVLNVVLNEETVGVSFLVRDGDDIWIKKEDIEKTDLREGLGKEVEFEGERYISLKSIPGISFTVDESEAALKTSAAPHLFKSQSISLTYERPYSVIYPRDKSAFLNYGVLYDDEGPLTNVSTEIGVRVSDYLALSTFNYDKTEDDEKWARLLTSVRMDDRADSRTLIFGDFAAEGGALGSSRILGGLSLSKNYSINPYFLRYPSLSLSGAVETPSEMEVYVNDQLVGRRRLNPGEFVLSDVPATVGLGEAKIIIKDIYGRQMVVPTPFYYSDRLIKKGLHEYSYNIGLERKDLGIEDFSYGGLEFLAFHMYGFSNKFKGGYALETGSDVINVGPTAAFPLPFGGVLDAAFSFTRGDGESGYGGGVDYLFRSKGLTAAVSLRGLSKEFSSLSLAPSDDKPETQFNAALGLSGGKKLGSASLDYSMSQMHIGEDAERWAVSYNKSLFRDLALFARLSTTDTGDDANREAFLGLHYSFDKDISGALSYTDREDDRIKKAGIQKNLPLEGGFGFRAEEESHEEYADRRAELQYQNDYGLYGLDYMNLNENENYRLIMSGGIGYVDGTRFLSRPIRDSFAKVKVGELEGVRVSHYGNVVTRTNAKGQAIVPVMQSFHDNRIGIDTDDIPMGYNIPATSMYINPPYRSGSVLRFEAGKVQGFFGIVSVFAEGKAVPVEFSIMRIMANGLVIEGLIGKGGEFYFENAPSGTHPARVFYAGRECDFKITIPESEEMMLNLGELICKFPEELPAKESTPAK